MPYLAMLLCSFRNVWHLLMTTSLKLDFFPLAIAPKTITRTNTNMSTANKIRRNLILRFLREWSITRSFSIFTFILSATEVNEQQRFTRTRQPRDKFLPLCLKISPYSLHKALYRLFDYFLQPTRS